MKTQYDYFGNTSLRVKNLLYNFETQLILFEELFSNADKNDIWSNDSELQIRYLELLKAHNLLDNKNQTTQLGTKDARVKSAPLEDFNLIKRKEKVITAQGYELLELIKNQSYKINNEFLQIDLVSLFFLKAQLKFAKSQNLLQKYLEVFREFGGEISMDIFALLPLINNFKTTKDFINHIKNHTLFINVADSTNLNEFLADLEKGSFKTDYFKTAKGDATAISIIDILEKIFLPLRENSDKKLLENLLSSQCESQFLNFKKLYLPYISQATKKDEKAQEIYDFVCAGDLREFGIRFYDLIMRSRLEANLDDYRDLNRRYLNLSGIFEFDKDKVSLNLVFKMILAHSKRDEILDKIATNKVSKDLLSEYFKDSEFITFFKKYGIINQSDLTHYKQNTDRQKLKNLIDSQFKRDEIIEILALFEDRKNDEKIAKKVTTEATIPTIFEYIIAIAWHYIDDENLDRILCAGLSLDSNLLPKSHAIGGEADFAFFYDNHALMIEVTLTEKTNQRRTEMESVSRHLGNLLLNLDSTMREKSYGIFITPYLDKNVLNDFRSRIYCYFEKESNFIKGMNILPLGTNEIIKILQSKRNYRSLIPHFHALFESKNDWGSKWYENEIVPFINSLKIGNV